MALHEIGGNEEERVVGNGLKLWPALPFIEPLGTRDVHARGDDERWVALQHRLDADLGGEAKVSEDIAATAQGDDVVD